MTRLVLVLIGLLTLTLPAHADSDLFNHGASMTVDSDLNSGYAFGFAGGQNAVVNNIQASINYDLNPEDGTAYLYTNIFISGTWGDPTDENPYYDLLENPGLQVSSYLYLTDVYLDGEQYHFDTVVNLNLMGEAGIYRNDEHTILHGSFTSFASGEGAIPISASSSVNIFEPGHPEWLPDWQVNLSSQWLVTTGFQVVPSPGALALLGLGALVGRPRRR